MLEDFPQTVITGVISCIVFELLKYIFFTIKNLISEKSLPFTVAGYWGAYHERDSYSAYEFIALKQQGTGLKFKLYQKTSDDRFHLYKGRGYIRGNKISLAYQEAGIGRSNLTGTVNLRVHNVSEHYLGLLGKYTEFSKDDKECSSYLYQLSEINLSMREKVLLAIFRQYYVKHFMDKDDFKNASKS